MPLLGPAAVADGFFSCHNLFPSRPTELLPYVTTCDGNGSIVKVPVSSARIEVLMPDGQIISPVRDGTGDLFRLDGIFTLGVLAVPGAQPGHGVDIVIRIWNINTGLTFESASCGRARTFHLSMLGGQSSPPALTWITDFSGFHVVPIFCCGFFEPLCPPRTLDLRVLPKDQSSITVVWPNPGEWIYPSLEASDDWISWQPVTDRDFWNVATISLDRPKTFFRLSWPQPPEVWPERPRDSVRDSVSAFSHP